VLLSSVVVYRNADVQKALFLAENKGKSGWVGF